MECVSQKNAKESSYLEDPWFSFIAFSKLMCSPAQTWCGFSQCIGLGKICASLSLISWKLPLIVLMYYCYWYCLSSLCSLISVLPDLWHGFAQVPGRLGCYQRSNRHRVSLYKFPGEGDHVSCVHKAALHRRRFPAGIRRRSKDYLAWLGEEGCLKKDCIEGRMTNCIMLGIMAGVMAKVVMRSLVEQMGLRC